MNVNEFVDGQAACRDGKPCPPGATDSFQSGYSSQYTLEQVNTHRSER